MTLTPCRECGQQVSTEAPACPHCGVVNPTREAEMPRRASGRRRYLGSRKVLDLLWKLIGL